MELPFPTSSKKTNKIESTLNEDDSDHFNIGLNDFKDPLLLRYVIIQRDEKGYGLTLTGDNPVFVQEVKEDGASARAGVKQGDRIIEVDGILVTESNHDEVVELIKSGPYVVLTLLEKPPDQDPQHSFSLSESSIDFLNSNKPDCSDPVDQPEKQQQLTYSRIHSIRKMLEKELVYLENLKQEFSKTPSDKMRAEMIGTVKRVKTLEKQLCSLTGLQHEQIQPENQQQLTYSRIHIIRRMMEKEIVYLKSLKSETPSDELRAEVNNSAKRVKVLQDQLCSLTALQLEQMIPRSFESPSSG